LVEVAELTVLVQVPGDPSAARAFTDAERDAAQTYAAERGGICIPIPLTPSG
jgi:hypothetical protein